MPSLTFGINIGKAEKCFLFNWIAHPEVTFFHLLTLPFLHPPPWVRASAHNSPSSSLCWNIQIGAANFYSWTAHTLPDTEQNPISSDFPGSGPRSAFISHTSNSLSRWLSFIYLKTTFPISNYADYKSGWPFLWRASRQQVLRMIPIQKHKHEILKSRDLFSSVPESPGELKKRNGKHIKAPLLRFWFASCGWEPGHPVSKNSTVVFDIQPR